MPRPLSIQLYTLRDQVKGDFPNVLKIVADAGYAGVEFAGLHGMKAAEVRKILDSLGLIASSAHGPVFDPTKSSEVIDDANALGYKLVGGGFGPKDFETTDAIKATAEKVNKCIDVYTKNGFQVFYHNHWWEWDAPNKGDLLFELCPSLKAQFDIYWVQVGGADPAKTITKYADRTVLIHVKDGPAIKDKAMTAVGKGVVDIKGALAAADKSKTEWYVVELDRCDTDMVQAVKDSADYLLKNKLVTGRK